MLQSGTLKRKQTLRQEKDEKPLFSGLQCSGTQFAADTHENRVCGNANGDSTATQRRLHKDRLVVKQLNRRRKLVLFPSEKPFEGME